jgi:hypothetical protein
MIDYHVEREQVALDAGILQICSGSLTKLPPTGNTTQLSINWTEG